MPSSSTPDPGRAPVAPDPAAPTSWWQQRTPAVVRAPIDRDAHADVVVIGAGVTGTSAARALARAGVDVVLLDARDVASGASGRNGGFLLAGLAHRIGALTDRLGPSRAAELHQLTADARDRLFATAAAIGAAPHAARTGSLRLAVDAGELDDLDREATLLEAASSPVERITRDQLPDHLRARFLGGLRFPGDGRSQPAAWVRALADDAERAGARIHPGTPAAAIDDDADGVTIRTAAGHAVRADRVVVATEAWLPGLLPELHGHVLPYRSQVLACSPPRDPATGEVRRLLDHVTWSRRGWDYAQQTADGHLVVGGELPEEVERLRTWDEVPEATDQAWLERWMREALGVEPVVEHRWAGVLSQTPDGFPWVGALPGRPHVIACGGWGGAGNVLGFACGELIADLAGDAPGAAAAIPSEFSPARLAGATREP